MSDTRIAVQTALIARYRGDTTLQGLLTGASGPEWNIFDQDGSGANVATFPSVIVHPIASSKGTLLSMGQDAQDVYMLVSVYTREEGFALARAIAKRIYILTDQPSGAAPLTLDAGQSNVWGQFENGQELTETNDGPVQHSADRYVFRNVG